MLSFGEFVGGGIANLQKKLDMTGARVISADCRIIAWPRFYVKVVHFYWQAKKSGSQAGDPIQEYRERLKPDMEEYSHSITEKPIIQ